jgi:hypothetical protein
MITERMRRGKWILSGFAFYYTVAVQDLKTRDATTSFVSRDCSECLLSKSFQVVQAIFLDLIF